MNRTAFNLVALAVGAACAVFLVWLWRADATNAVAAARRRAPPAVAPAAPPVEYDAETRVLLAALDRMLLRADSRAREGLLTFKDDAALRRFLARAAQAGLTVVSRLDGLRTVRVRYDALNALQRELVKNAGDYASVSANTVVGIPSTPPKENRAAIDQVPFRNEALAFLGAAGDRSDWGRGVTIAILDSGVASDATFGSGRLRTLDVGYGTAPGNGREDGHGTSVASLAAGMSADAPGVAPAASLLSIRVTDADGLSDIFTLSQAIVAAVDAGARIVNVSLGGYATNATLNAAIAYATERGALIVAAAGNDQAAQLAWPAADARVASVGAVDRLEQQVAFSNSGPQLQLTAPGYGVQTAWLDGERAYVDGTSASAPLVAGAVAAVVSLNPSLTPQDALQLLKRTASDAGAPGADSAYGSGILNLAWAMNTSTPGYVDTAVSSHYFDAANNRMEFVVQNRSSQAVAGLSLYVTAGTTATTQQIPLLATGESYVVAVPVNDAALRAAGTLNYTTQLANPSGLVDRVPANNRKSSVLSAPGK